MKKRVSASSPSDFPDLSAGLSFLLRAYRLKDEPRAGWLLRRIRDPESVADHCWGTALLCLLFADEEGADREKALSIALVHDLAEAETGDVASRADSAAREASRSEKARREQQAMDRLLAGGGSNRLRPLWEEYEEGGSREAVFVRDMNLIDMCLQALQYERQRRYDPSGGSEPGGGAGRLDEFFSTTEPRLGTATGRKLFGEARALYEASRRGRDRR